MLIAAIIHSDTRTSLLFPSLMPRLATFDADGWQLDSAEVHHATNPATFWIPPRARREGLQPGDGAKLLFRIAAQQGVERMWVIVRRRAETLYVGVLDSTPLDAEPRVLRRGDTIVFGPEHVADISRPDREYVVAHYGEAFFDTD